MLFAVLVAFVLVVVVVAFVVASFATTDDSDATDDSFIDGGSDRNNADAGAVDGILLLDGSETTTAPDDGVVLTIGEDEGGVSFGVFDTFFSTSLPCAISVENSSEGEDDDPSAPAAST
mmetsp:Transcript_362/g.527  ORF Transcript_362/g.527 Transcript_362/m.527 type:complete len:119 (-) Transcript_362:63-419(-)